MKYRKRGRAGIFKKKEGFGRDGREKKMDGGKDREGQIERGKEKSKEKRKGQGRDGGKPSDRDRVGLKEMEAEMKERGGRMNMESSEDWFDLPLFFFPPLPISLPPSSCFPPSLVQSTRAPSAKEKVSPL